MFGLVFMRGQPSTEPELLISESPAFSAVTQRNSRLGPIDLQGKWFVESLLAIVQGPE
jgi:hypothetical protein